jgi:hypothetical protein
MSSLNAPLHGGFLIVVVILDRYIAVDRKSKNLQKQDFFQFCSYPLVLVYMVPSAVCAAEISSLQHEPYSLVALPSCLHRSRQKPGPNMESVSSYYSRESGRAAGRMG